MPLEHEDIDRLVKALEECTAEAHCLWQSLDEARTDIVHELRRLLDMPQKSTETVAESISCAECSETADSLSEALQNGWTRLQADLSGLSWNYLGICPSCSGPSASSTPSAEPEDRLKAEGKLF